MSRSFCYESLGIPGIRVVDVLASEAGTPLQPAGCGFVDLGDGSCVGARFLDDAVLCIQTPARRISVGANDRFQHAAAAAFLSDGSALRIADRDEPALGIVNEVRPAAESIARRVGVELVVGDGFGRKSFG